MEIRVLNNYLAFYLFETIHGECELGHFTYWKGYNDEMHEQHNLWFEPQSRRGSRVQLEV